MQLVEESDILLIEPIDDAKAQVLELKVSRNNRKRGIKVLNSINRWSPAEDEKLLCVVQTMELPKTNWKLVAQSFVRRSPYACEKRYEKLIR